MSTFFVETPNESESVRVFGVFRNCHQSRCSRTVAIGCGKSAEARKAVTASLSQGLNDI